MANNYCQTSFIVDCGTKEARDDVLAYAMAIRYPDGNTHPKIDQPNAITEAGDICGGVIDIDDDDDGETSLWFCGEECFDMGYFDSVIEYALKTYKLPPVSYTWADSCSKMRTDEFSGGACVFVYNAATDTVKSDSMGSHQWARTRIQELTA